MSSTKRKKKPPTLDHSSFFNSKSNKHNWKSRAILKANWNKQTGNRKSKQTKKKQQNLALNDLEKLWARQEAIDEEVQFQQRKNSKKEKKINTKKKKRYPASSSSSSRVQHNRTKQNLHFTSPLLSSPLLLEKPAPAGTNKNRHIFQWWRETLQDCLFLLLQHYKTDDKPKQKYQLVWKTQAQRATTRSNNKQTNKQTNNNRSKGSKLQNNKLVALFVVLLLLFPTTTAAKLEKENNKKLCIYYYYYYYYL